MNGGQVVLAINIAAAAIFIFGYAMIACSYPAQRPALWFSGAYALGTLSQGFNFLIPLVGNAALLERASYASFQLAILLFSAGWATYHRRRAPWRIIATLLGAGAVLHEISFLLPPATFAMGMAYQLPFAAAAMLAAHSVLSIGPRSLLVGALGASYGLLTLNFLAKPFLALAWGFPTHLADYTATSYALLSQASTGILMLGSGMLLLLIVANAAIAEAMAASETDALSGLLNRRGFERLAQEKMARSRRRGEPLALALFDLDHFKQINDRFGHDGGDQAIACFAARLRQHASATAVIARLGGEEFAMLVTEEIGRARDRAEAVRVSAMASAETSHLSPTTSAGVAQLLPDETLFSLLRRADQACYAAKNSGRNKVWIAGEAAVVPELALVAKGMLAAA
jgi:diguanylate cyclase (GGDEF)-like protein